MVGIDINVKARGRMRINEAARAAGVSARSLRHYEVQGLLAPRRDDLGYRVYGSADIEVAKGVQALIAAGFSTNEIAQIAPCLSWDGGVSTLCPESVRALRAKMLHIDETIGALQAARDVIERVVGDADDLGAQG